MHYIQENQYRVIFVRFWCFSMKNVAQIMGLLFGSVGTHTYQKSEEVSPPPPQASSWGIFLRGQIPQLLRTKKVRNQEPQGAKAPPLGQLFSKIQQKSTEMLRTCLEILKQWTQYGYSKHLKSFSTRNS